MAIARAGFADLGGLSNATPPMTASFTNTGNILFVFVDWPDANPTSVTFNGSPFTVLYNSFGGGRGAHLYYLTSPALTTANIVVNFPGSNIFADAAAVAYSGVDLSAFDGTSQTVDSVSETSYASTVSTTVNNCWGVGFARSTDGNMASAGGDFTTVVIAATFTNCLIADTNGPISPARALTFTTSGLAANVAEHVFVSLLPLVAPPFSRTLLQWTAAR